MAIDLLTAEKECEFSAQDRYNIIEAAIIDSYDDGFMNEFICVRALYCYIHATLSEDDPESRAELFIQIHANPLSYWEDHLDDIEVMLKEHETSINVVCKECETWFTDYTEYAYSVRGMLDNIAPILDGVTQRAQDELANIQANGELQDVLDIADSWGLNREFNATDTLDVIETVMEDNNNDKTATIINAESLFEV